MRGALLSGFLLGSVSMSGSADSVVTAVFSSLHNGYTRQKLPDGTFKQEFYAIANGAYAPGMAKNTSIDKVPFPTIAGLVAQHLASQNYFLAESSKSADLLLLITWGTSIPFGDGSYRASMDNLMGAMNRFQEAGGSGSGRLGMGNTRAAADAAVAAAAADELEGQLFEMQMFNDMRRKADERNAQLLGYVQEVNDRDNPSQFAGGGTYFHDLISDLEEERYYVIVQAFDFRAATKENKRKLLWATRVSISAHGNKFNEQLAEMLAQAGRRFGQNSGRLIRQYQPGSVRLGDLKMLGVVPASGMPKEPPKTK